MTSNVGQNYPVHERDRGRAGRAGSRRWSPPARTSPAARGRDHAARRQRALVGLEVPDAGLPGPPPRRRLRGRAARGLRRLRRDLRQDLPALSTTAVADPTTPGSRQPAAARDRRARDRRSRRSGSGSSTACRRARPASRSIEAMAMSTIVFAGAAQFAAVGYVASGLAWPGIILLTALLNARHLLYSAALAPWLRERAVRAPGGDGPPPDRRGLRAGDQPLPADRPDRRTRLLDRGVRRDLHPVEPGDAGRGRARRPDPGPGPAGHRRHLPGGHDRPRGRAHHRPARAGRRDRRRRGRRRRRAGDEPVDRDRDRRDRRAAGRAPRAGVAREGDRAARLARIGRPVPRCRDSHVTPVPDPPRDAPGDEAPG